MASNPVLELDRISPNRSRSKASVNSTLSLSAETVWKPSFFVYRTLFGGEEKPSREAQLRSYASQAEAIGETIDYRIV